MLENVYLNALCVELDLRGIEFEKEYPLNIDYKGKNIGDFRLDLLIENKVVIELKSVKEVSEIHRAQILNYMRLGKFEVGLLINFNRKLLKDGIQRFVI